MPTPALDTLDPATLQDWRDNAAATWYGAAGHGKAAANEAAFGRYSAELTRRAIPLDDEITAVRRGRFNGPGSV